ncbi:MAG: hypothetical protein ACK5V3_15680, partial [Bdellovibrionales bacterium]
DYGAAKVYGVRTAGAGGTVENFNLNGLVSLSGSLTTSLMVRPGGNLVENYGVIPDENLSLRLEDVESRYANFFEFMMNKMGL